ncbi:MAG: hypothetical protein US51_C0049G0008 [Microgenomates group bacterium GW2011_GWA2_37_6]|nr:MAG: hypothetical protein US51_C0049G0008 [Microgenomates group bacterium GW2011_GWA2_37_6]
MPKIGNSKSASEKVCVRCKSRRRVSKTWTEKIVNDNGFMTLLHTQYVCTNVECQSAFDKALLEDTKKREKLKQMKQENDARRLSTKVPKSA